MRQQTLHAIHFLFIFLVFGIVSPPSLLHGQKTPAPCGTSPWSEAYRVKMYDRIQQAKLVQLRNDVTHKIPIKAHIIRDGDGSGSITDEGLALIISYANAFYEESDMEFFICEVEEVNNADYHEYDTRDPDNDTEAELVALTTISDNAINAYFVGSMAINSGPICGYAYFPCDGDQCNRTIMAAGCATGSGNGTFVHELGHYFSLPHTHAGTENGPTHMNAENVPREGPDANCDTDGDLLCDTEADPKYYSEGFDVGTCTYTDDSMDQNGVVYEPPINNIMSYYPDVCGGIFTTEQYTVIGLGLDERLNHTSYDYNCIAAVVNLPSDLDAADQCGSVVLNWSDMAANELGYLIERSEISASTGFSTAPGWSTGPDETSYQDETAMPNTDYWYRIKAINGDPDTYSNVAMVSVGNTYCDAFSTNNCGNGREYIDSVVINTIDHVSGCEPSGFECFTDVETELIRGSGYTLTVRVGNWFSLDDSVYVYLDWNADGDFDDTDEQLLLPFIGNDTYQVLGPVPVMATIGVTTMRVRVVWTGGGNEPNPCGGLSWSEAEDYAIDVQAALPVTLLEFTGQEAPAGNLLQWKTTREINNEGFEVLFSENGLSFERIGWIPAQNGNITDIQAYTFLHTDATLGSNFYKLHQFDFDGAFHESPMIEVRKDADERSLQVFPNPASDKTNIGGLNSSKSGTLVISDLDGRLVQTVVFKEGHGHISIETREMKDGLYTLSVVQDDQVKRVTLLVIH